MEPHLVALDADYPHDFDVRYTHVLQAQFLVDALGTLPGRLDELRRAQKR
jgi:hypothetical protein